MSGDTTARWEAAATELAGRVASLLGERGRTAGAAESVTGGNVSSRMSAAPAASQWFKGGVVAYSPDVKFAVLGVTPGPVITAECAREMATGAVKLLDADYAVATTGAGGPGPEEDHPAGTVFIAVASPTGCRVRHYRFDADPEGVVWASTRQALEDLLAAVEVQSQHTHSSNHRDENSLPAEDLP